MNARVLIVSAFASLLGACGASIPSTGPFPNSDYGAVETMNEILIKSIVCELSFAVTQVVEADLEAAHSRRSGRTDADFLVNWGVEVAIDLSTEENSSFSPSAQWSPPGIFGLGFGVSSGAHSSNGNVINLFFPLSDLYKKKLFKRGSAVRPCRQPTGEKAGSPLVDIDLQILPLLESRVQAISLDFATSPDKQVQFPNAKNVITQTVWISESYSAGLTPSWAFQNWTVDPNGPVLSAGRSRKHQVTMTFGPLDTKKQGLTSLAEAFHHNEQLRASFRRAGFN